MVRATRAISGVLTTPIIVGGLWGFGDAMLYGPKAKDIIADHKSPSRVLAQFAADDVDYNLTSWGNELLKGGIVSQFFGVVSKLLAYPLPAGAQIGGKIEGGLEEWLSSDPKRPSAQLSQPGANVIPQS